MLFHSMFVIYLTLSPFLDIQAMSVLKLYYEQCTLQSLKCFIFSQSFLQNQFLCPGCFRLQPSRNTCESWNKLCIFISLFFYTVYSFYHFCLFSHSSGDTFPCSLLTLVSGCLSDATSLFLFSTLWQHFLHFGVDCFSALLLDCDLWTVSSLWAVLASSLSPALKQCYHVMYISSWFYTGVSFILWGSNSTFSFLVQHIDLQPRVYRVLLDTVIQC